jgi:Glycosyl transferases group 1/Glycosyltransferase Family 4
MRVLHLDAGREMRGGQWQVLRLIEGLAANRVESTLLARKDAPLYIAARKQGWRVEPLGLTRAVMELRTHDLIHAHDARSHTLGTLLRARPLVVARRVAFPVGSRWKYGKARRYIAVSEFVKSVLIEGGVPAEKISVVYDGVPILNVAHGSNILRLEKGKAPADLENAIQYAAAMVYLTDSEGLGSGALLAMSAAVPVIASNVGGLREVITHRENGFLVGGDPAEIDQVLNELRADPELARRIGDAARQTVMERFTVPIMVKHTMEVYRQVTQ